MDGSFGFHDYEEHKARASAQEFERMVREDDFGFLDLFEIDQIYQYYLRTNNLSKAAQITGYALNTYPNHAELHHKHAQVLAEQGHFDRAIEHIELARGLAPAEREYLHVQADILSQAERYDQALKLLEEHLQEVPVPEELLLQMGNIAQIARQTQQSETYYREALALLPEFEDALFELAFLLEAQDRIGEAIQQYQFFLDQYPYNSAVWYQLGEYASKSWQL